MYDTILFDFDGTLVPSLELWLSAFQYALAQTGRTLPEDTIRTRFFYRDYDDIAQEFHLPSGAEFRDHVHDGLMHSFSTVQLYPHVRETLHWCRTHNLAIALVTSSPCPQVEHALAQLGLANTFHAVVTGSDITHYKPHPEPVQRALKNLNKPATHALLIGDYSADILAGQAAGTQTALFLPPNHAPFYDFQALRALGPTYEFTQWTQLQDYLQTHTRPA